MARLKYPGVRRTSPPSKATKTTLASKVKKKKRKEKVKDLEEENCKIITREEYLAIFGDSDEENDEDFVGFSSDELGLRAYRRLVSPSSLRADCDPSKSGILSSTSSTFTLSVRSGAGNPQTPCSSFLPSSGINQSVNFVKEEAALPKKSCYGMVQICDNIYTKTYKKRQSYGRRRPSFDNSDAFSTTITAKTKTKRQSTHQTGGKQLDSGVNTKQPRKAITLKSAKPLSIAKQLLERAKGERRLKLQRVGNKEDSDHSVSRFGRTVKKKVLEYDEFTSVNRKRPLPDGEAPPLKVFKGEEGERKSVTTDDSGFKKKSGKVRIKIPSLPNREHHQEARFPRKVRLKNVTVPLEDSKNELGNLSAQLLGEGSVKTLLQNKSNISCKVGKSLETKKGNSVTVGAEGRLVFKSKRLQRQQENKEREIRKLKLKQKAKILSQKRPEKSLKSGGDENKERGAVKAEDLTQYKAAEKDMESKENACEEKDSTTENEKRSTKRVIKVIKKMKNGKIKKIKYIKVKAVPKSEKDAKAVGPRRRRVRCGDCEGCAVEKDCGKCTFCRDMPKFGGFGVLKQCCVKRKCKSPVSPDSRQLKVISKPSLAVKQLRKEKREMKVKQTRSTVKDVEIRQTKPPPGPLLNHVKNKSGPHQIKFSWTDTYTEDDCWETGFHICVTNDNARPPVELCFLCGSAGEQKMLYCRVCAEPFHLFCLEEDPVDTQWWTCNRCRTCCVCGHQNKLLMCDKCQRCYHIECLGPNYPTEPQGDEEEVWFCARCVKCSKCGRTTAGDGAEDQWTHGFTMCASCGKNWDLGNFCPLCNKCYSDEDFESKMMQCVKCDHWIHAACQGLNDDEYQCLAVMPDDVQYFCKSCDNKENPDWLDSVRQEIQAGFVYIVDTLMTSTHYKALQKCYEQTLPQNGHPKDLEALQNKVKKKRYHRVDDYTKDLLALLNQTKAILIEDNALSQSLGALITLFEKEMRSIFPWQDLSWPVKLTESEPTVSTTQVPETTNEKTLEQVVKDHSYALIETKQKHKDIDIDGAICDNLVAKDNKICLEHDAKNSSGKNIDVDRADNGNDFVNVNADKRKCVYCNVVGDDNAQNAGRLLYFNIDEWAHVNCVLWSAEVYEDDEGRLRNAHVALTRGRQMRCEYCNEVGATVGCCEPRCPENYHFMCGRKAKAAFLPDKTVYCNPHSFRAKDKIVLGKGEFSVERRVCVDMSRVKTTKKGLRGALPNVLSVLSGSMFVKNLGKITTSSDTSTILIPVEYTLTKLYWSTINPNKRCIYTCRIDELDRSQKTLSTPSKEHEDTVAKKQEKEHVVTCHEDNVDDCHLSSPTSEHKTKFCQASFSEDINNILEKGKNSTSMEMKRPSVTAITHSKNPSLHRENENYGVTKSIKKTNCLASVNETSKLCEKLPPKTPSKTSNSNCVSAMDMLVNLTNSSRTKTSPACQPPLVTRVTVSNATKPDCDSVTRQSKMFNEIFSKSPSMRNQCSPLLPRINNLPLSRSRPVTLAPKPFPFVAKPIVYVQNSTHVGQKHVQLAPKPVEQHANSAQRFSRCRPLAPKPVGMISKSGSSTSNAPDVSLPCQNSSSLGKPLQGQAKNVQGLLSGLPSSTNTVARVQLQHLPTPGCVTDSGSLAVVVGSTEQITKLLSENPEMMQLLGSKSTEYLEELLSSNVPTTLYDNQIKAALKTPYKQLKDGKYLSQTHDGKYLSQSHMKDGAKLSDWRVKEIKDVNSLTNQNKSLPLFKNAPHINFRVAESLRSQVGPTSEQVSSTLIDLTKDAGRNDRCSGKEKQELQTLNSSAILSRAKMAPKAFTKVCKIVRKLDRRCLNNSPSVCNKNVDVIDLCEPASRIGYRPPASLVTHSPISSSPHRSQANSKANPQYIFNNRRFMHASLDKPGLENKANKVSPLFSPTKIIQNVENQSESLKPLILTSHGISNIDNDSKKDNDIDKKPKSSDLQTMERSELNLRKDIVKSCGKRNQSTKVSKRKRVQNSQVNSTKREDKPAGKNQIKRKSGEDDENTPSKKPKVEKDDIVMPEFDHARQSDNKNKRMEKVEKESSVLFTITSEEGFEVKATTCEEAWRAVFEKVQSVRMDNSNSYTSFVGADGMDMLGLTREPLIYLIEQLPGRRWCSRYTFQYHQSSSKNESDEEDQDVKENEHGCARAEVFTNRKKRTDMFSFLASSHRKLSEVPIDNLDDPDVAQEITARRATANDLPMAMRYRCLKQSNTKRTVGVFKSPIHRRGLFCLRDIDAGEMVIEYTGMVIRSVLTDKREKYYESKGIGCYMFRVDSFDVVDATTCGDAARFINHSCEYLLAVFRPFTVREILTKVDEQQEPNCYSRVITVEGQKKIIIFAARPLKRGEELTYDYKFPLEEDKIPCTCNSKKCRKYLN